MNRSMTARGVSLVELMVAISVLTIGVLGFMATFQYITKAIHVSRARTLAVNLAQEKVENLKNIPYYKLQITTQTASDANFSPPIYYDTLNYPPETIKVGGITFKRVVVVSLSQFTGHAITATSANYPDSGMKFITVYVMWQQGNAWKYVDLDNIYENPVVDPLNSGLRGVVSKSGGGALPGALVRVVENPSWRAFSGTGGSYSLSAQDGTYSIEVSSAGYYTAVRPNVALPDGSSAVQDFTLTAIASGTLVGNAWMNTGLVISQVVGATSTFRSVGNGAVDVEYVELFNPTTYPINIGQGATKHVKVDYKGENGFGQDKNDADFDLQYISTYVAPGGYYLIASTRTFMILGQWRTADATYGTANANHLREGDAGCFSILNAPDNSVIDRVGWCDDSAGCQTAAGCYEGAGIPDSAFSDGVSHGVQLVRVSSPLLTSDAFGRAYDSGDNRRDFLYASDALGYDGVIRFQPFGTTSGVQTVLTGKPALGAFVAANDLLGPTTQAYALNVASGALSLPYAYFQLPGVSTGTWTVIVASGSYYKELYNVAVADGARVPVPSAATYPAWSPAGHMGLSLSSSAIGGYVAGRVLDSNGAALAGIEVLAAGTSRTTGSNGRYFVPASTGPITVTVNPGNGDPDYVEVVTILTVNTGQITSQDFTLTEAGVLKGFITTDGNSILPNVLVTAERDGFQYANATSDSSGFFYLRNLASGTYEVKPVLDPMESYSPGAITATALTAQTVFVGTFTISGAEGTISGTVTNAGQTVTSGALVLASTATIGATPAQIVASSSPAQAIIYAASSKADGTYSLEVRGSTSTTFRVSAYVPVISGTSVTVTTKTYTGITVAPNGTTTLNITLP